MAITKKIKYKDKEYELEVQDALLVLALVDLSEAIRLLARKT